MKPMLAISAPIIVVKRQPKRFVNDEPIGPIEKNFNFSAHQANLNKNTARECNCRQ